MHSDWTNFINEHLSTNREGMIPVNDLGVTLDWKISGIASPTLAVFKSQVSAVACKSLAQAEVEFLRAYPKAVDNELFLKSCKPHLDGGDWDAVEDSIQETIKKFYTMDLSQFGEEAIRPLLDDIYFFATAKDDQTNQIVGFLLSSITPTLPYGTVKVINLWVVEGINQSEIRKELIKTVFKVIPKVNRVYLLSRPTNLETYFVCGFKIDECFNQDPNHVINLDYFTPLTINF